MHIPKLLIDVALIFSVAGVTTLVFTWLKQPVVLGYLLAGFLTGPHFILLPTVTEMNSINVWGEIGVIFLLFSLGLEFSFRKISKVGSTGLITAFLELVVMFSAGYLLGEFLHWKQIDCIFLGAMLSISSTTIIVKAYGDLGLMKQKTANVVFGVLIFEDLIAVLLLVILSTIAISKTFTGNELLRSVLQLVIFLVLVFTMGIFFIPTLFNRMRKIMNDETLLVLSIGLCFLVIVFATKQGFSSALGAFLMGTIIAETREAEKIHQLIKPLKHLFGAVFFVSVGMLVDFRIIIQYWFPILCMIGLVLFLKTSAAALGTFIAGEPLKRSIKVGYSLCQIGEFSFIIATLGIGLKVINDQLYPIIVSVSVMTTFCTPYFIRYGEKIYDIIPYQIKLYLKRNEDYQDTFITDRYKKVWYKVLKNFILQCIVFSTFLIIIFFLSTKFLSPFINRYFVGIGYKIISSCIILIFMSPFIYGLIRKPTKHFDLIKTWNDIKLKHTLFIFLFLLRYLLALLFVSMVISYYFGNPLMLSLMIATGIVLLIQLSRISMRSYKHLEAGFLKNFNRISFFENIAKNVHRLPDTMREELHIESFSVGPNSICIGQSIEDLQYRERFGINIISIIRGKETISLPLKNTLIFPYDTLLVIGNDQCLNELKNELEIEKSISDMTNNDFHLFDFVVLQNSPIAHKTLEQSDIRKQYKMLILCIEKKDIKIFNPTSQTILEPKDYVWTVCTKKNFEAFIKINK